MAADGSNGTTGHVLVAYASEFGATQEVAELIAQVLRESGTVVDLRLVMDVNDVQPYRAVVLGSAIYNGAWLPEAIYWAHTFEAELAAMPVAYFAVSMTMRHDTPQNRQTVRSYLESVRAAAPSVRPVSIGLFAGRLRYRNLPVWLRLPFWIWARLPSGDYRNWNAVRAWATAIHPALLTTEEQTPTI